ncbi:hypothetical protein V6Z93_002004 [Aspergillus fumigatus]
MIHVVISLILTPDKVVEVNESRCAITGVDANGVMLNVASNYGTLVSRKSMHNLRYWGNTGLELGLHWYHLSIVASFNSAMQQLLPCNS